MFYPICINCRVRSWRANDPMNQYQYHMTKTTTTSHHICVSFRFAQSSLSSCGAETTRGRRIQSHNMHMYITSLCDVVVYLFFLSFSLFASHKDRKAVPAHFPPFNQQQQLQRPSAQARSPKGRHCSPPQKNRKHCARTLVRYLGVCVTLCAVYRHTVCS